MARRAMFRETCLQPPQTWPGYSPELYGLWPGAKGMAWPFFGLLPAEGSVSVERGVSEACSVQRLSAVSLCCCAVFLQLCCCVLRCLLSAPLLKCPPPPQMLIELDA